MRPPIRFGVLYGFRNRPSTGYTFPAMYRRVLEQIREVDRMGFHAVWLTEHHFADDGYLPSPLVMSGAIAAITEHVEIGHDVLLVPFHNPVRLAEDLAVLDVLSDGRIMLGAGMGYVPSEFAGMGVSRATRRARMDDALAVLAKAWREEEFDFDGEVHHLRGVRVRPRPVRPGGPPLWVASTSEPAARRAARFGAHLLPQGDTEAVLEPWRRAVVGAGGDPAEHRIGLARSFVVDDHAGVVDGQAGSGGRESMIGRLGTGGAAASEAEEAYARWFAEVPPGDRMLTQFAEGAAAGRLLPQETFTGSARACREEIERMHAEYGITDFIVPGFTGSDPVEVTDRNLGRLADEVIPHLG